ncbi:hypothetical protein AB1Y20_006275 [Prymnesium parvum]|uniref:C2H2-type domain-containing protein n=1 Tax=Prymnesium parvum TaxID=97485 RepID=A0AB34J5H5_PRYPA
MRAAVLVLGDVGRSPRMQYHALSLAQHCSKVYLIGHVGERCVPQVEVQQNIIPILMSADLFPRPKSRFLYVLCLPLKAVVQMVQLLWTLLVVLPRPDLLLVQTPPAIPTLAAAWALRLLRGCTVVVDWHNLGYSVLQQSLGTRHALVVVSRMYEQIFGRALDGHLCVTRAMADFLHQEWAVKARVLYDRPPSFFRRLDVEQRHALFRRLQPLFVRPSGEPIWKAVDGVAAEWVDGATPFTCLDHQGRAVERARRPMLLVSSTSWSADEDFALLLDSLAAADARLAGSLPEGHGLAIVAIITGKGPQKAMYEARMATMALHHVAVATMWLAPGDYPQLLGSADLGVCLHTSTSGLDLPMKVLDMFGCNLPVCAVGFQCISELVKHQVNGFVFHSREELTSQLLELLSPSTEARATLTCLRQGVSNVETIQPRWAENWSEIALPLFADQTAERLDHGRCVRYAASMLPFGVLLARWALS